MAASLNKLPCELLQMIVDGAEDQRDKLSLAICCSHVHQEVLPNCHISLKLKRPSHIVLRRVLKLSYCNSRVGRAVWDLHLEGWPKSYTSKEPLRATGSSTEKDIHFYASQWDGAFECLGYSEWDKTMLKASAVEGNGDALVTFLLLLLPNIRKLRLGIPRGSVYVDQLFRRFAKIKKPFHSSLPLAKLTHVSISPDFSMGLPRNRDLWQVFTLPKSRRVSSYSISEATSNSNIIDTLFPTVLWPVTSPITHIELLCTETFGVADLFTIEHILTSSENKEPYRCLARWLFLFSRDHCILEHAKSTLRSLRLGYEYKNGYNEGLGHQSLDSWVDFSALVDIHLSVFNLIDFEKYPLTYLSTVLPPSLESLSIGECPPARLGRVIAEVAYLILNVRPQFPQLTWITIEGYWYIPGEASPVDRTLFGEIQEFIQRARDLSETGGVSITLKSHPAMRVSLRQMEFVNGKVHEDNRRSSPAPRAPRTRRAHLAPGTRQSRRGCFQAILHFFTCY